MNFSIVDEGAVFEGRQLFFNLSPRDGTTLYDAQWAPDGQHLFVVGFLDERPQDGVDVDQVEIFRIRISTGRIVERMTRNGFDEAGFVVSPDGLRLVLASGEGPDRRVRYAEFLDSALTDVPGIVPDSEPRWAFDSRHLVFSAPLEGGIAIFDTETGAVGIVGPSGATSPDMLKRPALRRSHTLGRRRRRDSPHTPASAYPVRSLNPGEQVRMATAGKGTGLTLILGLGLLGGSPELLVGQAQTQTDDFTRYELQEPGSAAFRIIYDVSATTPGARFYYNGIRTGAEEVVHGVRDLHTGEPLEWELVDGAHARENGHPRASEEGRYIKVTLARPVPEPGQGRVRIDKTYVDEESYFVEDGDIVFDRSLGIRRNAVVLPAGYELVQATYPVQLETEADGRLRVSFMNPGPAGVPFRVRARALTTGSIPSPTRADGESVPTDGGGSPTQARVDYVVPQRAFQDRDITYYLQQPETHSFRLFHDYTESRDGMDRYLNVVRAGSSASDPEAYNLDTGERLEVEQLVGAAITERGIDIGQAPESDTEVVVIWFDPVTPGASVRLRIWETYTDPGRYLLHGEEFVWDRNFGRARNTLVLPEGWYVTANAIPGVVDETDDGRLRIRYINPQPDGIQVFVKGRRR